MNELRVITAEPIGANVIELLEQALERARAGEFSSCALAIVDRAGVAESGWSSPPSYTALIGAVARLQHRLMVAGDTA